MYRLKINNIGLKFCCSLLFTLSREKIIIVANKYLGTITLEELSKIGNTEEVQPICVEEAQNWLNHQAWQLRRDARANERREDGLRDSLRTLLFERESTGWLDKAR